MLSYCRPYICPRCPEQGSSLWQMAFFQSDQVLGISSESEKYIKQLNIEPLVHRAAFALCPTVTHIIFDTQIDTHSRNICNFDIYMWLRKWMLLQTYGVNTMHKSDCTTRPGGIVKQLLVHEQTVFIYCYPHCPSCLAHLNSIGWAT